MGDRPDGDVDIVVIDVLPQMHHSMCLCHADDAFKVAHRNGHAMTHCRLPPQLGVHLHSSSSGAGAF